MILTNLIGYGLIFIIGIMVGIIVYNIVVNNEKFRLKDFFE